MSSNELSGVNKTNHRYVAVMKNSAHTEKVINSGFSNQIRSDERGVKQSVGMGLFMFVGFFNSQNFFIASSILLLLYLFFYFLVVIWPHIIPLLMFHQYIRKDPQCSSLHGFNPAFSNISIVAMTALKFAYVHLCTVSNISNYLVEKNKKITLELTLNLIKMTNLHSYFPAFLSFANITQCPLKTMHLCNTILTVILL